MHHVFNCDKPATPSIFSGPEAVGKGDEEEATEQSYRTSVSETPTLMLTQNEEHHFEYYKANNLHGHLTVATLKEES
ncbi:MAG: hypothetical protein K2M16_02290 [Muribaculaceae bacterium]|nr:hypothetical protein [Muribaculaceae bacterium]